MGTQPLVLWTALAIALSPGFAELLQHWIHEPWARGSAVFVPIAIASAIADPSQGRPRRAGWLLVAAGGVLILFGASGGFAPIGRLAVPFGVFGMALAIGHPTAAIAAIVLFVVPPPFSIVSVASPDGERVVAQVAVEAARVLGADWLANGETIRTAGGDLRLGAPDLGVPLAHLFAGLGYCAGLASGATPLRSGLLGLWRACWALPAQALAVAAALGLLAVSGAGVARTFLDLAPACVATAIAIARFGTLRMLPRTSVTPAR